jgi:diadenylate cyclase
VNYDHLYQRLTQLITRIQTYAIHEVIIELLVIWIVVYAAMRILRGTRGARVIKGTALFLLIASFLVSNLDREGSFERLTYLYNNFIRFAALAMVIAFQPELRRALSRLGDAKLFQSGTRRTAKVIEEIIRSVTYLSHNKIGALIAIERQMSLESVCDSGTVVQATVSHELLNTIFWPGSALHDMGVVVRGEVLAAAGVQFPLAEGERFETELGSRHRSAIGLSQEVDAMVIVVSEETGTISLAERGTLVRNLSPDDLRTALMRGLQADARPTSAATATNASEASEAGEVEI